MKFKLKSSFVPKGDQPLAIKKLTKGLQEGKKAQVLLGITGSGKTFTMANVIAEVQRPTLILAHNKTLAAQLYQEFKAFFPENAVEYFVSYYDYYQPEVYIARTDTYIEKDKSINDQIDRMRLSATKTLVERKDIIIIASVSCIYGIGLPEYYSNMQVTIQVNQILSKNQVAIQLLQMHYGRANRELSRGSFRIKDEILEIMPAYEEALAYRIEWCGEEVKRMSGIDPITGKITSVEESLTIFPGSHHVTPEFAKWRAIETIQAELVERMNFFEKENRITECQRILERTKADIEMLRKTGRCKGIENYSRHFNGRQPGEAPPCLLEYFPSDFLLFVDESHQTLPQIQAMYKGDFSRKKALVEFGFRLPSAYDNRPLKFEEFYHRTGQVIYVSATPGKWEIAESGGEVVRQIIRPTGLIDPWIEIKPAIYQVDDALQEIKKTVAEGDRILVTVLTKKLAEDLTHYLNEMGVKANYLHANVDTLERVQIINSLRKGEIEVLVGINLLREGLDIPEVSLVIILDADKEGFLRSLTSLIQTCGRAARNVKGRVIMYADKITSAIQQTLNITIERRVLQKNYNDEVGIKPHTTKRAVIEELVETFGEENEKVKALQEPKMDDIPESLIAAQLDEWEKKMKEAAKNLRFKEAIYFRERLRQYGMH